MIAFALTPADGRLNPWVKIAAGTGILSTVISFVSPELADKLTRPLLNWCGAHPFALFVLLGVAVAIVILLAWVTVYVPMRVAGLKARYPKPRPPEIAEQLARLNVFVRFWESLIRRFAGAQLDDVLPKDEESAEVLAAKGDA